MCLYIACCNRFPSRILLSDTWNENWWLNIHTPDTIPSVLVKAALLDSVRCRESLKNHSGKQQVEESRDSHSHAG